MSRVSIPRRHHIIISCDVGGSVLIVIGCRIVLSPCSLFSSVAAIVRRTAVVSHPSSVSFSYELGKTAQDWISRSSLSGVPTLLVPRLALPSRRASRLSVSCGVSLFVLHALRAGAAWRAYSSHRGRSSRAAWRGVRSRPVRRLVLVSSWRLVGVSSSVICPLRWRCMLAAPRGCVSSLVSWSGEASASRIITDGSGLATVLVLLSRGRCLLAFAPSG